ncbi:hypothetical protein [Hydrogenophaga sp. 5NK40-0174]|uniref:hypothetical protein n=1 Tax=Hydrogenophaga sp. 5NK40-0174 TaxID=3127649 RepID=UPI00334063E8
MGAKADHPLAAVRGQAARHWRLNATLGWLGLALTLVAPTAWGERRAVNHAPEVVEQIVLACEAVYLPARSVWNRKVLIEHDQHRVRAVFIDGVRVYSFSVHEHLIFTALDNERIEIDLEAMSWKSDFRGMASGWGQCRSTP